MNNGKHMGRRCIVKKKVKKKNKPSLTTKNLP